MVLAERERRGDFGVAIEDPRHAAKQAAINDGIHSAEHEDDRVDRQRCLLLGPKQAHDQQHVTCGQTDRLDVKTRPGTAMARKGAHNGCRIKHEDRMIHQQRHHHDRKQEDGRNKSEQTGDRQACPADQSNHDHARRCAQRKCIEPEPERADAR